MTQKGSSKDLLFDKGEEDSTHSASLRSFLLSSTSPSSKSALSAPSSAPRPKPTFAPVPESALLSKLRNFLPEMAKANQDLQRRLESGENLRIEDDSVEGKPYVHMDFALAEFDGDSDEDSEDEGEDEIDRTSEMILPNGTIITPTEQGYAESRPKLFKKGKEKGDEAAAIAKAKVLGGSKKLIQELKGKKSKHSSLESASEKLCIQDAQEEEMEEEEEDVDEDEDLEEDDEDAHQRFMEIKRKALMEILRAAQNDSDEEEGEEAKESSEEMMGEKGSPLPEGMRNRKHPHQPLVQVLSSCDNAEDEDEDEEDQ
eukprot:GILI01022235.1.p1 GENE.GILI01022235.1~~GILI01022235.1.p1  ORF type:complete len:314 (+),score=89.59 GILI01022235.1:50-991(+)